MRSDSTSYSDGPSNKDSGNTVLDKWKLVPEYLKIGGLAKQHIESFNYFVDIDIKHIVKHNSMVLSSVDQSFYLKYEDIHVGMPEIEETIGVTVKCNPHMCRISDQTYSAPIYVNIEYIRSEQRVRRNNVIIGSMPIMLRSSHCVLNNKSEEELMKLGECPLDPGGYFLIFGTEKVILMQEQLSNNKIMVDYDSKGELYAQVRSMSQEQKTRCSVVSKKNKYYITHNILKEKVNVVIIFKAMGITSDNAIVSMISNDNKLVNKLAPTFYECDEFQIHTKEEALLYLGKQIHSKQVSFGAKAKSTLDEARHFLGLLLFTHIPQKKPNDYIPRAWFLGNMIRRLLQTELYPELKDDLDHLSNKRLHTAGNLLSLLFEDAFKRFNQELKLLADRLIPKIRAKPFDIVNHMRPDMITNVLINAIQTGNWTIRRFRMHRQGVTQVLSRLSYLATLGMMTRINSQFERSQKLSGPRALHLSQWGMICPCDTPEGEACGLIKNMAFTTHVTTNVDDDKVNDFINRLGLPDLRMSSISMNLYADGCYIVFINGEIIGSTRYWKYLIKSVRTLRQCGLISPLISVSADHRLSTVYICTDGGRLCRPLIRVQDGKSLVTEQTINDLDNGIINFSTLVKNGCIEFLDVNEESDSYISLRESDITKQTTHLEIALFSTLGICAGIIPYAHHNQSPRNTYQCAMGKQAMGIFAYNQFKRLDTVMLSMVYPQKPLAKTRPLECIHFDQLPGGQNAIVAVMSYSGYDIEDAIIMNKASLDRGFGRCQVFCGMNSAIKKYPNRTCDRIMGPMIDATANQTLYRHKVLGNDGLANIGMLVRSGQVLINKSSPKVSATDEGNQFPTYKDVPTIYKMTEPAYVDSVMLTSASESYLKVKILLRQTRTPEVGDKFSSRHGQKGVIGLIVGQENMPFTEDGLVPDIIMNPHGFPSRMTVGKLLELLAGKSSTLKGKFNDATAFEDCKVQVMHDELMKYGFNYAGKDILYSGITGEPLTSYIYFGPIYYQKLKHMVQDKIHARSRGPRVVLTRQPTEGRSRDGGLRIGEMERDCLICYGASFLINERLMLSSDVIKVDVCGQCGLFGYNGWCAYCKSSQTVHKIKMPYSCKLLFQELIGMNVVPRIQLASAID